MTELEALWDPERSSTADAAEVITVGVGDCRVSSHPDASLVTHALGSCIAVAVHDPIALVGGLLHFLLPEAGLNRSQSLIKPYMFADTGIPELFLKAYALGADKRRMLVWVIGGAQVMDPNHVFNIGLRNYEACRRILSAAGVMIHGEAVGGGVSRTVRLDIGSGELRWNSAGGEVYSMPSAVPSQSWQG